MTSTSNDSESVLFAVQGRVALIELNRPDRMNAVDDAMIGQLQAALQRAEKESGIRAVTLIGVGRSFMSGADLTLHVSPASPQPGLIDRPR